jgi:Xaa-Pro aminopeptidase
MSTARADRIAGRLVEAGLDLLLVTDLTNLRYLTGFTGSNGMAVVGRDLRRFVTDFRYVSQAEGQVAGFDREEGPRDFVQALADGWPDGDLRVGFEDHKVSVKQHSRLREIVPGRVELVPAGTLVEEERAIKDPGELDAIRAAVALADAALRTILDGAIVGRAEREIAFELETEMRRQGAEDVAFSSIVASAEHGARPHAVPREVPIAANTLLTFDWGARVDGYHSDGTRTVATGVLRPGISGRDADAVARDIIEAAGHGEHFGHGLGHGIGLEVHEAPTLSRTGETVLKAGHVVTIEPGVYVPGLGGVRIEDLAIVTEDGREIVSSLPRGPITVS